MREVGPLYYIARAASDGGYNNMCEYYDPFYCESHDCDGCNFKEGEDNEEYEVSVR